MKSQGTEWEEIFFKIYIYTYPTKDSHPQYITNVCKKKTDNPIEKCTKIIQQALHRRVYPNSQYIWRDARLHSSSKTMSIKTTIWLKWKSLKMPSVGKDVEYPELSYTANEMIHWHNHLKKLNMCLSCDPAISSHVDSQRKWLHIFTKRHGQEWA